MTPPQDMTPAYLAAEPLLNRILAFGEILMAAGTSARLSLSSAQPTPSSFSPITVRPAFHDPDCASLKAL